MLRGCHQGSRPSHARQKGAIIQTAQSSSDRSASSLHDSAADMKGLPVNLRWIARHLQDHQNSQAKLSRCEGEAIGVVPRHLLATLSGRSVPFKCHVVKSSPSVLVQVPLCPLSLSGQQTTDVTKLQPVGIVLSRLPMQHNCQDRHVCSIGFKTPPTMRKFNRTCNAIWELHPIQAASPEPVHVYIGHSLPERQKNQMGQQKRIIWPLKVHGAIVSYGQIIHSNARADINGQQQTCYWQKRQG